MCKVVQNPADRQYVRRCQMAAVACLLLYVIGSQTVLRAGQSPFATALAAVSGLGFFGELVCLGLLVMRTRDEFQRVLLARSFTWATLVTMGLASAWGFMELCAHGSVRHLNVMWVPIFLVCTTAAAKLLIFRQYRTDSE